MRGKTFQKFLGLGFSAKSCELFDQRSQNPETWIIAKLSRIANPIKQKV
ncbi:MAG: hypothetical protein NTU99_02905 [Pseudanabaena sp. LacPavin_0818_WC45_MAG_42_6]|nr:hypothetical protein [Pseudanabaena sp. LacPavin_0818_WC45_MAG_42_6]